VGLGGVNNSWLKVEGFLLLKVFLNFNHMCFDIFVFCERVRFVIT